MGQSVLRLEITFFFVKLFRIRTNQSFAFLFQRCTTSLFSPSLFLSFLFLVYPACSTFLFPWLFCSKCFYLVMISVPSCTWPRSDPWGVRHRYVSPRHLHWRAQHLLSTSRLFFPPISLERSRLRNRGLRYPNQRWYSSALFSGGPRTVRLGRQPGMNALYWDSHYTGTRAILGPALNLTLMYM